MILTSIYCVEKDIPMTYTNFTQPDPLVYIIVHNFDFLNWRTGQNSTLKTNITIVFLPQKGLYPTETFKFIYISHNNCKAIQQHKSLYV